MPTYIVTGKLGGGKTLAMVGKMREYLEAGKPVATNVDLDLRKLLPKAPPKSMAIRLPDRPTAEDLDAIGSVHETGRDELNGALVLDECGTWLNARQWSDKGRQGLIEWFLHARKRGWDVYLIVQNISLIDKQLREVLGEYIVICRRLDRLRIPGVGRLINLLSLGLIEGRMPQIHIASVRYGSGPSSMHADTWYFRGRDLYGAYKTVQVIGTKRTEAYLMPWDRPEDHLPALPKPKLRAIELAGKLPRDDAWRLSRRYVAAL
jgi:hypothetical protein